MVLSRQLEISICRGIEEFLLEMIDDANDNTFSSFSDFEKSINKKEQDAKICCNIYPCIRMIFHLK